MKPEEAISAIKNNMPTKGTYTILTEGLELAVQSLEKQIAKKPRYYVDMYGHNRPGCPGCPRNEILYAGQKYCKVCGTKIDWEAK